MNYSLKQKTEKPILRNKLPLSYKILLILILETIYLFVNWKIYGKINFGNATPMDWLVIISIALFGGLILAFNHKFGPIMSFLFYQPSSNPWVKAFYIFVAASFAIAIILIVVMLVFYQEIFNGDMFVIFHK